VTDEQNFGDYEPEDAWQADDPIPFQIENLLKRLDVLAGKDGERGRFATLLDVIESRLRPWRDRYSDLTPRQQLRVDQLAEDLDFLRHRDEEG